MPTPRNLNQYPISYLTALLRAAVKPVTFACDSPGSAKTLRGELYLMRAKLVREAGKRKRGRLVTTAGTIRRVRMRVVNSSLILEPRLTKGELVTRAMEER
jgi:hypothetical protein